MNVGVMKDYKLELRNLHVSDALGWSQKLRDLVVYYESIKRELKTKPIYECLCDERPKKRDLHSSSFFCFFFPPNFEKMKESSGNTAHTEHGR